jgi:enterochelin esterase-like enzyme
MSRYKSGYIFFVCLSLAALSCSFFPSSNKGTVIYEVFTAPSLKDNPAGEKDKRKLCIYLPPGYNKSETKYPVIYFLHGFNSDQTELTGMKMNELMDDAINEGRMKAAILVFPGSDTKYGGSFYTNSAFTGQWADYIGKDVVQYIDAHFRTLPARESRGLAGHSMGGNGALKIAMFFPDVFGSLYAMSPSVLDWSSEFSFSNPGFKTIYNAQQEADIFREVYPKVLLDMARTYSPNLHKPPYFADLPVTYQGDSINLNRDVIKLWESQFPIRMLDTYTEALKTYHGIRIDWGEQDEYAHIPVTCRLLSKKLHESGVQHEATGYEGGHGDKLAGKSGRINLELIPFFQKNLVN